jgi:cellular retinoic acid-binding protein 2
MLKLLDVNMLLRKAACASTPKMEVSDAGGVWTIKTSTTLKSMDLKFKLGEEFDETTPDGRQTRALINVKGGKIVCTQTAKKATEKSTRSVRELNGPDELIYTMTIDEANGVTCVQKFKRIA